MLLLNKYLKAGKLLIACLLLFKNIAISQNLVQNGSFENYTNPIDCGSGGFDNYYYSPAPHVLNNWYGYQSPDYFNAFCNPGGFNVPNSYFGNNYSKNGIAFVGIGIYEKGGYGKEYIYQQLDQPLQAGKVYCLSFYVNRADRFTYAIKNIGALFSTNLPVLTNGYEINAVPQVENQSGFLIDTTQWLEIQGCFIANGGEKYIIIGNFTTNYNTDTLNTNSTNLVPGRESTSYYYIDDVSLVEDLSTDVRETIVENGATVFPNPANSLISINMKGRNTTSDFYKIKIADISGKKIIDENYIGQLDISVLEKGIYFLSIYQNDKLLTTKKVIKE